MLLWNTTRLPAKTWNSIKFVTETCKVITRTMVNNADVPIPNAKMLPDCTHAIYLVYMPHNIYTRRGPD